MIIRIRTFYDAIEEGNEFVSEDKWFGASKTLVRSLELVRSRSYMLEEENIRILPASKLEMVRQQQKLVGVICQQWRECLPLQTGGGGHIPGQVPVEEPAAELMQAMFFSELLEEQLVRLTTDLKHFFLEPIRSSTYQLDMQPGPIASFLIEA